VVSEVFDAMQLADDVKSFGTSDRITS